MNFHDFLYLLFVHATLLLPGYVAVKKWGGLSRHPGIELPFAYLLTLVFFAAIAFADYVLRFNPGLSRAICWGIILYSAFEFFRAGYYRQLLKLRFPLICLLLMSLMSLAFISLSFHGKPTYIPDPGPEANRDYGVLTVKVLNVSQTQANDNYIPYRQAQFIANRSDPAKDSFINEWGVHFFQRTPLMGAVTANYFNLLGDRPPVDYTWSRTARDPSHTYAKFQIIAAVLNALFIVPAFFLLIKFFNRKTALIACLFMVSSQFFLYNAVFSWPKSLVAFFILLSWLLLLERRPRYTVLAGAASGVAYLTHDLSALYIGGSVVMLLWDRRFRETLVFGVTALVFAIPWLIAADFIYHEPSSFIYYPISTQGIPQPKKSQQIIHQFLHTPVLRLLSIRLHNFLYLMSPYELFTSSGGQDAARRVWATGLYSIPGSLGFGLLVPAFLAALKRLGSREFWILALTPVVLSCIGIGWSEGLGSLHFAEGVVVLFSGLAVSWLLGLKSRMWLLAAFFINCAQFGFFVGYSYKWAVGAWFVHPADLVRLALMAAIVMFCGWTISKTLASRKNWLTS